MGRPVNTSSAPVLNAIGLACPEHLHSQETLIDAFTTAQSLSSRDARRLRAVFTRAGIERRRGCLPLHGDPENTSLLDVLTRPATTGERMSLFAREAPRLLRSACQDLLSRLDDPSVLEDVRDLRVASCTGFLAPGLDRVLVEELGLRSDVHRTLVGFQGCQAGLVGLRDAAMACRVEPGHRSLVACLELSSLHVQAGADEDPLVGNALFGDGAALALVSGAEVTDSDGPHLTAARSDLHAAEADAMTWTVGDAGFALHLDSRLAGLLAAGLRRLTEEPSWQAVLSDRDAWAVHPGGPAILGAVREALDLSDEALAASRAVLAEHGNMSSPTIFFVLERLLRDPNWQRGVALAFGPGLSTEAIALERA
ncbi:MAG: type III polyketide synthase [Acidobacteriota bacterium]